MADNVGGDGKHRYRSQWQAYRNRRNLIAVILVAEFLSFFPFWILVATIERHFFSPNKLFFPAAFLFGAVYLFTGSRLRRWPCPRCGKNFLGTMLATSETVLGRTCAHCGLPRYAEE